jgi:Cytochrome oxidase complex assembly protein 1
MNYVPPPPAPSAQPPAPRPPDSPLSHPVKSKLKWIIISVVLGILVLVVLFAGAIVSLVFGAMKSSEPYQHAVQIATHDPRVLARLGAPVRPGWLTGGSINVAGDSGQADLTIPLQGATDKGKLYVVARKSEGEWSYVLLAVRVEGSAERIDLLRPSQPAPPVPGER